jgi:hypothetical protein
MLPLLQHVSIPQQLTLELTLASMPGEQKMDVMLNMVPVVSAIGYSIVYLLAGGGLFGAFVIFVLAKMFGH